MKNLWDDLEKNLQKIRAHFEEKTDENIRRVQHFREIFVKEMDYHLEKLSEKRDLIGEVVREKLRLKKFKKSVWETLMPNSWEWAREVLAAPFILMMIIPAVILHVFLELYHQTTFRILKIPMVRAREYFHFDRKHLPYLNVIEKFNCAYCSYFNNLIGYTREIAGRTERYWCPIKQAMKRRGAHGHYEKFFEYNDPKKFRKELTKIRGFEEVDKK